ncbi:hypothetical protein OUZ56_026519 [Daphnia magna]|uniref:Uncharacterized protein n=1 Tax=Daphnia magna TaxID=35525 RepID=A0ABQ9ZM26_9CRUS|nr:hypothetical protein OUZ56_026519 [Daphnia magna]
MIACHYQHKSAINPYCCKKTTGAHGLTNEKQQQQQTLETFPCFLLALTEKARFRTTHFESKTHLSLVRRDQGSQN